MMRCPRTGQNASQMSLWVMNRNALIERMFAILPRKPTIRGRTRIEIGRRDVIQASKRAAAPPTCSRAAALTLQGWLPA
jgi:hypothetical protein